MDPALRVRLDLIIGLLACIAVGVVSLLLLVGGFDVLLYLVTVGLLVGLLVQALGVGPFGTQTSR
ncbi:hypothetical protein SAMN05216226_105202 [Halovenus aranensis]|jgi:hypothetical protein|uniref:Uncharacterized protein n=1 Tax=Halovenus aranensis TaxID=890420 RepID=A0A1G8UYM6_9EURY|nr:hypothetical protein [Halovenus aranensis]SDJ58928.1 hypothetical protein SAMN05216226_105202 [Halovenus aranensis]